MEQRTESWFRLAIAIVTAMLFIALALWEAIAADTSLRETDPGTPWVAHTRAVDEALARKDLSMAIRSWHDAYRAALGSRRWEGMVEVGDAYLRIGETAGLRKPWEPKAWEIYLNALSRARHQTALNGVLRVAEAFAGLGDHEVAEECLRVAGQLAVQGRDPQAYERIREFRERLATLERVERQ